MSLVLAKALELGAALSECEELREVREAERAMLEDPAARALIEEFQNCRQELEWARLQGMEPTAEQEEAFRSVRERMNANPHIIRFLEAQERFEKVLQQVNQIISHALYGGCGGGCAGCSGCEE